MDVALLFLPLVGGYKFASASYFLKYSSAREDGHRLYFRVAFIGAILFVVSAVLRALLLHHEWYAAFELEALSWFTTFVSSDGKENAPRFSLAIVAIYAMFLGWFLGYLFNPFFNPQRWLSEAFKSSAFDTLIHRAASRDVPVCVTMDNNKVYVGYVVTSADTSQELKSIGIIPLLSGYRKVPTRTVVFTTNYRALYGSDGHRAPSLPSPLSHATVADFEIALPTERIHSCNMFDFKAYDQLKQDISATSVNPTADSESRLKRIWHALWR